MGKQLRGFEKRHIGIFGTKGKPGTRTNTATTVMETIAGSLGADLAGRIVLLSDRFRIVWVRKLRIQAELS